MQTADFAVEGFRWNGSRYQWTDGAGKGQFASRTAILNYSKAAIVRHSNELIGLADKLESKQINLADFQREAAEKLKKIHIHQAIQAARGSENLFANDYLIVARQLRKQYYAGVDEITGKRYGIQHLAAQIANGEVSLAQLKARLKLYAQSGKSTYWEIDRWKKRQSGITEGKRILMAGENCPECIAFSQIGWTSIESIVMPTQRCSCKNSCRCRVEWR